VPIDVTPPHPEYPCAHCITSNAIAAAVEAMLGTANSRQNAVPIQLGDHQRVTFPHIVDLKLMAIAHRGHLLDGG